MQDKVGRDTHRINIEIQALRGASILFVVFYHMVDMVTGLKQALGSSATLIHGAYGVDLFFVISGYVITRSAMPQISSKGTMPPLVGVLFWLRRICRTLPPALVWLAIVLSISVTFSDYFGPEDNQIAHARAALLQYANIYIIECAARGDCGIFGYYWTLSTEEQFYFLFPFAFALMPIHRLRWFTLAIGLLLAVVYSPIPSMLGVNLTIARFQSLRFDGLLLGVSIALFQDSIVLRQLRQLALERPFVALAIGAACHWLIWTRGLGVGFMPSYVLTSVACSVLVILAISDRGLSLILPVLRKPLAAIGTVSYSMYLCHVIAIYGVQIFLSAQYNIAPEKVGYFLYAPVLLLMIVAVSAVSYRLIELPCKGLGRRITKQANIPKSYISWETQASRPTQESPSLQP